MKSKITLYILLIFFFGTFSSSAQSDINALLDRLNENHMGSITDVFTVDELALLRSHLDATGDENTTATEGGGKEIFAPENVNGNFGHFNTATPDIFNMLGPSGTADFDGAGAYNPFTGTFFVIDNAGNAYDVNPGSGVYSLLGTVTPPAGESVTGIEFDPDTEQFYAISSNGMGTSSLSTVDIDLLTMTLIGDTGLIVAIALGFDLSGIAYSYDIDNDMMYTINKMTAEATPLGPIGFDASFGQGMFLCPTSGNLYMTAFNNGPVRSEFRMVDTTTGNTTLMGTLGSTSPGGTLQFAWSSSMESSLAIEDLTATHFTMYPNPAKNVLNLSSSSPIDSVEVYNLLGQKLMEQQPTETAAMLDISTLKAGTYIITASTNGQQSSQLFIRE